MLFIWHDNSFFLLKEFWTNFIFSVTLLWFLNNTSCRGLICCENSVIEWCKLFGWHCISLTGAGIRCPWLLDLHIIFQIFSVLLFFNFFSLYIGSKRNCGLEWDEPESFRTFLGGATFCKMLYTVDYGTFVIKTVSFRASVEDNSFVKPVNKTHKSGLILNKLYRIDPIDRYFSYK